MVCCFCGILRAINSLLKRFSFFLPVLLGITGQIRSEELGFRQSVQSAGEAEVAWILWQVPSHHRNHFTTSGGTHSKEFLGLVHSDLCGKINTQSLGGDQYFLTLIDDKTCYVWVYPLKHKDEVFFNRFLE